MVEIAKLSHSIKIHEGLRNFPYTDTTGHSTIGYGRNLSGRGITDEEADFLLSNDIAICQKDCEQQIWWPNLSGDDVRARALMEIVFNIGIGGLHTFTNAVAALAAGDFATAANEFENSKWFVQVGPNPGQRGHALVQMIRIGQD